MKLRPMWAPDARWRWGDGRKRTSSRNAAVRSTPTSSSSYIARYLGPPRIAMYRAAERKPGTESSLSRCSSSYQRLNASSYSGSTSVQSIRSPVPRVFFAMRLSVSGGRRPESHRPGRAAGYCASLDPKGGGSGWAASGDMVAGYRVTRGKVAERRVDRLADGHRVRTSSAERASNRWQGGRQLPVELTG